MPEGLLWLILEELYKAKNTFFLEALYVKIN